MAILLRKTVPELRRDAGGTRELGRMLAYLEEHPVHEELWHMTASICCAIYRAAGDKRCQPKDFLPKRPGASPLGSAEALANKFRAVLGGMVDPDAPKKKARDKRQ